MKPCISIVIKTFLPLQQWSVGKNIMSILADDGNDQLTPVLYGSYERKINKPIENIDDLQADWGKQYTISARGKTSKHYLEFYFKNGKAPKYFGTILYRKAPKNNQYPASARLILEVPFNKKIEWSRLFKRLCGAMEAEYGVMHYFDKGAVDKGIGITLDDAYNIYLMGSRILIKDSAEFPELSCMTYIGKSFISRVKKDFDLYQYLVEKTDGVDGFECTELGVMCTVFDDLSRIYSEPELFQSRKEDLKKYFPEWMFLDEFNY